VVAYGEILPQAVLDLPAIAPVNLHFSLLPDLRGASPVQTALLEGRHETGVTTIVMDTGIDTGPVIVRRAEAIESGDDAGSLGDRLATIGAEVLVETADLFAEGAADPRQQDEAAATFTRRMGPEIGSCGGPNQRAISSTAPGRCRPSRARPRGSAART
jgi:methionyl-tRNA formyltransferase